MKIFHEKTWISLRKINHRRENVSPLIPVQNAAIRTNNFKAKIDKTQENRKCRLFGGKDETINQIMRECSKLAQKKY